MEPNSETVRNSQSVVASSAGGLRSVLIPAGIGDELFRRALPVGLFWLTPIEWRIMKRAARGDGRREMAIALGLRPNRVDDELARIFCKTRVANVKELCALLGYFGHLNQPDWRAASRFSDDF